MEDVTQLDLVDYITDNVGDDDMQSRMSPLSEADCVHSEHNQAAPPAMSPYRLLLCLLALGWTERGLARRLGRHQTTIRRWADGSAVIDHGVAEWLEMLVSFHAAHPAPRAVGGTGLPSGCPIPAL